MLNSKIKLIVGLGNPGEKYTHTRHNAGVWFIELLAAEYNGHFKLENKFNSLIANIEINNNPLKLIIPTNYMNENGVAVRKIAQFYKIKPEEILLAHDEIDLPTGAIKLKAGGGHGGHNGLRNIKENLQSQNTWRLRIGVGHPGSKELVTEYVLSKPSLTQKQVIIDCLEKAIKIFPEFINSDKQKAITILHTDKS